MKARGILFLFLLMLCSELLINPSKSQGNNIDYLQLATEMDITEIEEHVQFFSSLDTRHTGSKGYEQAATYIYQTFTCLAMSNVSYHYYETASEISYGACLEIPSLEDSPKFTLHPLRSNLVSPVAIPPEGLSGRLAYVGNGDWEDLRGKQISDSVVLMDFNSGRNWVNIASLGARAVVFIEPADTCTREADLKSLELPLSFPRFYLTYSNASKLLHTLDLAGQVECNIKSGVAWEKISAKNVLGLVEGSLYPNEYLLITAYFDSSATVLSIAPGAEESAGIATLLEYARYFSTHTPLYSILFVAFSGHANGLAGSRWFAEDYLWGNKSSVGENIVAQFNLDLNSKSEYIQLVDRGELYDLSAYDGALAFRRLVELESEIQEEAQIDEFYLPLSVSSSSEDAVAWTDYPRDNEPLLLARAPAYSFASVIGPRKYYRTPLDTFEKINFESLEAKASAILYFVGTIANTENVRNTVFWNWSPDRVFGYLSNQKIVGTVTEWNETKDWYDIVPDALVVTSYSESVHDFMYLFADSEGRFEIPSVFTYYTSWLIEAYVIDNATGQVLYAPDRGMYQMAPERVSVSGGINDVGYVSVFSSSSIVLSGITETFSMAPDVVGLKVFDIHSQSHLVSYSSSQTEVRDGIFVCAVFVPPNTETGIVVGSYDPTLPLAVLVNASEAHPEGGGYELEQGSQLVIPLTPLAYAIEFSILNEERSGKIRNVGLETDIEDRKQVKYLIEKAREALDTHDYEKSYLWSIEAWGVARSSYSEIRSTINDTFYSIPYFSFMMIPFVLVLERLLFDWNDRRRILVLVAFFLGLALLFGLHHPSFYLEQTNYIIGVTGVVILVLSTPLAFMIVQYFRNTMKYFRQRILGAHRFEKPRGSLFAFSVAIRNLKRRRIRSMLTIVSLVSLIFGLTCFSSMKFVTSTTSYFAGTRKAVGGYNGIFVKRFKWGELESGLGDIPSLLHAKYHDIATIVSRAWIYPAYDSRPSPNRYWNVSSEKSWSKAYSILALTSVDPYQDSLVQGRWFLTEEERACIISNTLAETLEVEIHDRINLAGMDFRLIGILDETPANVFAEMDGEQVTPLELVETPPTYENHFNIYDVIAIPYKLSSDFGGRTMSVSLIFDNATDEEISNRAKEVFFTLPSLTVYYTSGDSILVYTIGSALVTFGIYQQIIPFVLVWLIILLTMLGSVQERLKEIFVYGSLGLSPFDISMIFLAEAIVFSISGGNLGYIAGIVFSGVYNVFYPGTLQLNYASSWVSISVGVALVACVSSSLYPAFVSSRQVTPSYVRKWKIKTKPTPGGVWEIPLPFIHTDKSKVDGIIAYLKEYLDAHVGESEVFSVFDLWYSQEGGNTRFLSIEMSLPPYEAGIRQNAKIIFTEEKPTETSTSVSLKHVEGDRTIWQRSAHFFVDSVRKQFLNWSAMKEDERRRYSQDFLRAVRKIRRGDRNERGQI